MARGKGRPRGSKNRPRSNSEAMNISNEPPHFTVDRELLRSFVNRIEKLEFEKNGLQEDIKAVYAEGKDHGIDTKTVRKLIAERRRDQDLVETEAELLDIYRHALGMLADTPLGQSAIERHTGRSQPLSPRDHPPLIADAMERTRQDWDPADQWRDPTDDNVFDDDELPPAA